MLFPRVDRFAVPLDKGNDCSGDEIGRHLEPSPATHALEDRRKITNGMEFVPRVEISIFFFCTNKNKP